MGDFHPNVDFYGSLTNLNRRRGGCHKVIGLRGHQHRGKSACDRGGTYASSEAPFYLPVLSYRPNHPLPPIARFTSARKRVSLSTAQRAAGGTRPKGATPA